VALHETFQKSKITFGADEKDFGRADADLPASAACQAFLADDKRLSLLADIGAGTIDQALLAVLPSRFNTVRLLGLCEKVLVIDEAHAYDTFVGTELERLLAFHRANGGSAIVLSATLPNKQRLDLVAKWQALRPNAQQFLPEGTEEERYPLATIVGRDAILITEIEPSSWSRRSLPVRLMAAPDAVLAALAATVRAGGVCSLGAQQRG
jgi:CRISPR-associated endonuclease/helicase Cas3